MNFTLLASGSSGNSCIVEENNTKIMIDCGTQKAYFTSAMQSASVSLDQIDALFITHGHTDHISRLKTVKQLKSYGTFMVDKNEHTMITTNESIVIKDLKITSIPLSHDFPKTVGYIIESNYEKLIYITDTGYINERYLPLLQHADFIVMESNHDPKMLMQTNRPYSLKQRILSSTGHLSNQDSAQTLANLNLEKTKQIVLAHLSQEANDETLALDILNDMLRQIRVDVANKKIVAARQYELLSGGR